MKQITKQEKKENHNKIYENFMNDLIHHDDVNDVRNFIERKMKCFDSIRYKIYIVKFNNFTKGVTISMVQHSGITSTYFNKKETEAMILYAFHKANAYNKFKED